ncbi:MAG: hypothetical protein IKE58_10575 [Blautia sp.]|nr:hypothetical protein [Blautia sp.]
MYALYMTLRKLGTRLAVMLKDYLEREEAAVVMFTFADQERATRLTMEEERREGENKLSALMKKMKDDGCVDDAFKAATDVAFREKMYKAYGMPGNCF